MSLGQGHWWKYRWTLGNAVPVPPFIGFQSSHTSSFVKTLGAYNHLLVAQSWCTVLSLRTSHFNDWLFFIRFWYLRCCGCPWNRGRQHLATPLKTCQNIEAGWLLCLSPNSDVTASETPPFPHLGCVPAVVPAKGGSIKWWSNERYR